MKTRSLLISLPGHPFQMRNLLPNDRLAGIAGGLLDAGHDTQVLDYGTVGVFGRLFPSGYRAAARPLADRVFNDYKRGGALDALSALWRLRGLKGLLHARRRDFLGDVVSDLTCAEGIDFVLFDVGRVQDFSMAVAVARGLRAVNHKVRLIASGPFIYRYAGLLPGDVFDAYCTKDGERTVVRWAEWLDHPEKWALLSNVMTREASSRDGACSGSLNLLPRPIYDEAIYPAALSGEKFRMFSIECSRGCSRRCPHCPEPAAELGGVQIRSARQVCEETARLTRLYRSRVVQFAGSVECANYAASLAYEILSRGLNVRYARTGAITGMNSIICSALKASGCQALTYRLETGSQRMLEDYYRLGFGVSCAENVLRASRNCGLFTVVRLSYPAPPDDYHTKEESLRLLDRTQPHATLVQLPEVTPGSMWYDAPATYGFELDRGVFVRHLTNFAYRHAALPRLWRAQKYRGQTRTVPQSLDLREQLLREIEGLGISTSTDAEIALVARVSGHEGHEDDYGALLGRQFFTGDAAGLASAISCFNEKAWVQSGPGVLGYPDLAAVGN